MKGQFWVLILEMYTMKIMKKQKVCQNFWLVLHICTHVVGCLRDLPTQLQDLCTSGLKIFNTQITGKLAWYSSHNYEHDDYVSYILCCTCRSLTGRILSMFDSSLVPWMNYCMRVKHAVNQSLCAGSVRSGTHTHLTSGTHLVLGTSAPVCFMSFSL